MEYITINGTLSFDQSINAFELNRRIYQLKTSVGENSQFELNTSVSYKKRVFEICGEGEVSEANEFKKQIESLAEFLGNNHVYIFSERWESDITCSPRLLG